MKKFDILTSKILREMAYGLGGSGEQLSKDELIKYIMELDKIGRGTMNISFTSITIPKFRKTGFPYKNLYKVKQTTGKIGTDYQAGVNRQREKEGVEGEFKAQSSSVIKERLSPSVGITFKGNAVLIYKPASDASNTSNQSFYFAETQDGQIQEVEKETIKPFLPSYVPPQSQGVEKTITYLTYSFSNIIGMKIEGKDHAITDIDPIKRQIFEMVQDRLKS